MMDFSFYKQIIDGIEEAIFIHNSKTGAVIDVNDTMLEMYGYKKDEVVGMVVDELSCVEEGYTFNRALSKIDNALMGFPMLFEWKAKRKDGTSFWCEVSLKLVKSNEQEFLIAVVRNVSGKKKNEQ